MGHGIAMLSLFVSVAWNSVESRNCTHYISLDGDDTYNLSWNPPEDKGGDSEITFKVEVKAKGYFVLGFSPDGGIPGSDIVTGWMKDGEVHFQDRHADASSQLIEDDQQDYELINAYENNESNVFEFRRKLNTCDENDMVINENTMRLIYFYSNEDPDSEGPLTVENANSKSVILLTCNIENNLDLDFTSLLQWNLTAPGIDISSINTYYFCKIVKSPQVPEKHHIVYIKPIIQEGHEEFLSHMGMYECLDGTPEEYEALLDERSFQCYQPDTPVQMYRCQAIYTSWTIGSKATPLPNDVGIPIHSAPGRYYMFEIHYNNPKLKTGIIDHSGFRLYYTPNLREFEAGHYSVGASPLPRLFIPPGQEEYVVAGHSNPDCVSSRFPESGVKVFAVTLQAFFLGRRFKVRHFRGNRELPPLADDKNFDPHYRPYRYYIQEVLVLPNDQITVECTYDSSERVNVTMGGLGTQTEMCIAAFLYYHLSEGSTVSYSATTFAHVSRALNTNVTNEEDVARVLMSYDWSNADIGKVQDTMRYSEQESQCYLGEFLKDGEHILMSYPNDIIPYEEESTCNVTA